MFVQVVGNSCMKVSIVLNVKISTINTKLVPKFAATVKSIIVINVNEN